MYIGSRILHTAGWFKTMMIYCVHTAHAETMLQPFHPLSHLAGTDITIITFAFAGEILNQTEDLFVLKVKIFLQQALFPKEVDLP